MLQLSLFPPPAGPAPPPADVAPPRPGWLEPQREAPARRQAEGYYVENFRRLLDHVVDWYDDLLSVEERALRLDFAALSEPAQRLYVRLISRRGPCFRSDRLRYPEIPDLATALDELVARAFLVVDPPLALAERLELLDRGELADLTAYCRAACRARTLRRSELVAVLCEEVEEARVARLLDGWIEAIVPLRQEVVLLYRILFFGNLRQDLRELVLTDLGVVRYEPYPLASAGRFWKSRRAVDDGLELRLLERQLREALAAEGLPQAVELGRAALESDWDPTTRPLLDRFLNRLARALERAGEEAAALGFYASATAPPSRERRARILVRLGRDAEARALCEEIRRGPRDESEAHFRPCFLRRLLGGRSTGSGGAGGPGSGRRAGRPASELLELPAAPQSGIEAAALEALGVQGRRGFFAENWLWRSLFGCAFWDLIFAPVPGAFAHPFQAGPLDLWSGEFRRRRAEAIAARLQALARDPSPGPRLLEVLRRKWGIRNPFVAWRLERLPDLELALRHLDGRHLAHVCDRLSRDPHRYRSGFPDLFVLRDRSPGFELLEVKGPNDQLRPQQRGWLDYLEQGGLPAAVLETRWKS